MIRQSRLERAIIAWFNMKEQQRFVLSAIEVPSLDSSKDSLITMRGIFHQSRCAVAEMIAQREKLMKIPLAIRTRARKLLLDAEKNIFEAYSEVIDCSGGTEIRIRVCVDSDQHKVETTTWKGERYSSRCTFRKTCMQITVWLSARALARGNIPQFKLSPNKHRIELV